MKSYERQTIFELEHRPALGRSDFMVSPANHDALILVERAREWPHKRIAVIGPQGSGKTHLAHVWMQASGARRLTANELSSVDLVTMSCSAGIVVDDCDRIADFPTAVREQAEDVLFHLYNRMAASGLGLMIIGRTPPAKWSTLTRDLSSRLSGFPVVQIASPDDVLLSSVLVKLFADRQIHVGPDVINYVVRRMDRSFGAAGAIVDRLDRGALVRNAKITKRLARELLGWADRKE